MKCFSVLCKTHNIVLGAKGAHGHIRAKSTKEKPCIVVMGDGKTRYRKVVR